MTARPLRVDGAFEFTPRVFPDDRGLFLSPFQEAALLAATGHRLFPVAQTNHSHSQRGVVRGVHFTVTPPGMTKYVYCARGKTLDIVIDIRVGSPTFGQWDAVVLDPVDFRAMYFPLGVGHAFVALEDETVMCYLVSKTYAADQELALSVFDPVLGLPIPEDMDLLVSDRDKVALTLAQAEAAGILPDYQECLALEKAMYS
ncbi:MAG: dTDP-4-dehydrorhamnose 3,5-epimerase family protein [Actinomycetota bacterium]|nr:dTDP-4-dehydrorhamnose 3,5-epimerase family protein [Actinomycetota bacterium]